MKATGEVMAIDRTFGSALNKALRGLEQAGAGPLAEDPSWTPTFDYLGRGLRPPAGGSTDAATDARRRRADPLDRRGRTGLRVDAVRPARRAAPIVLRRFLAPSDSRLWRLFGLLRRGVPEATIQEATGIAPWFLAEMGRSVALELEVRAIGAPARGSDGRGGGGAPRHGQAGRLRRPRAGRDWPASRRPTCGRRAPRSASVPGYAMVDTCAAEFAAETPYFYSTYAAAGSDAGGAAGRPRRRRSSSAAARSGSGRGSSSTTARSRPPTRSAPPAGRR